jgi:hypothetical protein
MNQYKRAYDDLQREMDKQVLIKYSCAGIALHTYWGWGTKRITRFFEETFKCWNECGKDNTKTMVEMLENETGIELRPAGTNKSYHEVAFLDCKNNPKPAGNMTFCEVLYMRAQQKRWLGSLIIASLFLGLYRKEGFGAKRLTRLLTQMEEIEKGQDSINTLETV